MGWHLIVADAEPSWIMETLGVAWTVFLVLVGVNLIILVHEWGHFIVARLCGVKCEKFYVWFDIFGWKLFKFRWGDTEYGLGVLPLGGYVKMLGQEDNPARLREELERAKSRQAAGESGESFEAEPDDHEQIDIAAAEAALYDPRSYLAKNVPQRMAIIVAGVVMNVVFAFVAAAIAYSIGVEQTECVVGTVFPGEAAWRANFQVDDRILQIAGRPSRRFTDLNGNIAVGDDIDRGVSMEVSRRTEEDAQELIELTIQPDRDLGRGFPTIGIASGHETRLYKRLPVFPGSPAALAEPRFQAGDQVVQINGTAIESYSDVHAMQARYPDQTFSVTIQRQTPPGESAGLQRLTIEVPPAPMRRLGLVMTMGPITAIQDDSPAATAADPPFMRGDVITEVADDAGFAWDGDPMTLPDQLRRLVESRLIEENPSEPQVTVTVARPGESSEVEIRVPLRPVDRYSYAAGDSTRSPVTVAALGIAYRVTNQIQRLIPGGPAEKAGMRPGGKVLWAQMIFPDLDDLTVEQLGMEKKGLSLPDWKPFRFKDPEASWTVVIHAIQETLPGTRVKLKLDDGSEFELAPAPIPSSNWYYSERGLMFGPATYMETADSFPDAIRLGVRETVDSLTMIFRTVKSLGRGQVSMTKLAGPLGIVEMAYRAASRGPAPLLIFLCLISANLAVVNMLPIPVLDGGHLMFLTYEGIRRKPPSEKVHVALMYLGLIMLLALMVWVMGLDISRLFGFS